MLKNLHIQHYALIENLDIDFESGFSVITGETGAGKSILLGALSLLLGGRADATAVSPGARKCVVEASFSIDDYRLETILADNDIDMEGGECMLRRELTSTGKSRAFINDTPVALTLLKAMSVRLVDIHSQHHNLLLADSTFQLDVVDSVADNGVLRARYTADYDLYRTALRELNALRDKINADNADADYLRFRHNELSSAGLVDGQQEELEEEQLLLDNAEAIKEAFFNATSQMGDALTRLREARRALERITDVMPAATAYLERIDSADIELDDMNSELTRRLDETDIDPARLEEVNSRLAAIYALQKKYHKGTVAELLDMQAALAQQLHNISNSAEVLDEKERQCRQYRQQAADSAALLSKTRHEAATTIQNSIVTQLQQLGMPNVTFSVDITDATKLTPTGQDEVCLLFSANSNMPPRTLAKIASGGEMARVMLALKALLSQHKALPTIIFDEIDTGVSGKISDKMANVMSQMARHGRQVICITHQPQIAAAGQHHYRVYKEDSAQEARTHIEALDTEMRVNEIAKMLSGEHITQAAISNAKTLLKI